LAPVNARLSQEGKPTVTLDQLETALRDATATSLRQGRFDSEVFATALAGHTALTRQDIDELVGDAKQRLATLGDQAAQTTQRVATITGRAFWGVFGIMLLSLLTSVLGAIAGVTPRQRELSAQSAQLPLSASRQTVQA